MVAFRDEDGDTFEVSQMRDDTDMLARKTGTPKAGDIYTDSIRRDFTTATILPLVPFTQLMNEAVPANIFL